MTWIDLVREYFPDAADSECDRLLWNDTCFPFGTIEQVQAQLERHAASGKTIQEISGGYRP